VDVGRKRAPMSEADLEVGSVHGVSGA
jgi:hypothetical protein